MTRQQQWNEDTRIEKLAARWIDRNFYGRLFDGRYERNADIRDQWKGVDVWLYDRNDIDKANPVAVDEKYKVYRCLNEVYQSPGFELTIYNKAGYVQDGWFSAQGMKTKIYATVGLSATVEDVKDLKDENQITGADVLLNTKKSIRDYVETYTPLVQLMRDAQELRDGWDGVSRYERKRYAHDRFWLTYSPTLDGKPVNVVIPRTALESLPNSARFVCRGNGIERIRTV